MSSPYVDKAIMIDGKTSNEKAHIIIENSS